MDLAQTLKDFRQANELEQDALATLLGTTQQTISNWESGTMPRATALNRINHLLKTYKKGEAPVPWVPPAFHPAITEIHEIPLDPEAQKIKFEAIRERNAHAHGHVYSEYETKRSIAEALGRMAEGNPLGLAAGGLGLDRGTRFKPTGDLGYRDFMQQVVEAMPVGFPFETDARVDYQGLRLRADYLSSNVCAEVKEYSRGASSIIPLELGIHRLSTLRKVFERQGTPRARYILMFAADQGAINPRMMNRVMTEAALHDVHVFAVQGPKECAQLLAEMESSTPDDFEDEFY